MSICMRKLRGKFLALTASVMQIAYSIAKFIGSSWPAGIDELNRVASRRGEVIN